MRQRLTNYAVGALVAYVCLFMFGCATFTKNAYRTLSISGHTYNVSMQSAAEMYAKGDITDDQKDDIIRVADNYRDAYILAVDALVAYETHKTDEGKTKLEKALDIFMDCSEQLTELLQKYIGE